MNRSIEEIKHLLYTETNKIYQFWVLFKGKEKQYDKNVIK